MDDFGAVYQRACAVGVAQDFAVRAPVAEDVHGVAVIQAMHGRAVGVAVDEDARAGILQGGADGGGVGVGDARGFAAGARLALGAQFFGNAAAQCARQAVVKPL